MGFATSIFHRLRHNASGSDLSAYTFCPNYILPQPPSIGLQGEGHTPGDTAEVFGFEAGRWLHAAIIRSFSATNGTVMASFTPATPLLSVAIPQIHKAHATRLEHPTDLTEHLDYVLHEQIRGRL